jgi:hypothetical protein
MTLTSGLQGKLPKGFSVAKEDDGIDPVVALACGRCGQAVIYHNSSEDLEDEILVHWAQTHLRGCMGLRENQ